MAAETHSSFALQPVAPSEFVQKGMEIATADVAARLHRERSGVVEIAAVRQKIAQAQLMTMRKAGVEIDALIGEARQARLRLGARRLRDVPKKSLSMAPGLRPKIPTGIVQVPGFSLVTPPYSYDWSTTQYIDYGPGTLSAHADRFAGSLGFVDASDPQSVQVDVSYAIAAVGIYFKPLEPAVLTVGTDANIYDVYDFEASFAGANTRGWAGFLVQGYDANNALVETPILQRTILFDYGSAGNSLQDGPPQAVTDYFDRVFVTPQFFVNTDEWYAIWFWCGGDIHAEGWAYPPLAKGSDASAEIETSVPFFLVYLH